VVEAGDLQLRAPAPGLIAKVSLLPAGSGTVALWVWVAACSRWPLRRGRVGASSMACAVGLGPPPVTSAAEQASEQAIGRRWC
jgi:hypothetical protein